jgi:transcription initiation factor TFIID subunit 4
VLLSKFASFFSEGCNNAFTQSLPKWPTSSHEKQTDCQNQEPKIAQKQEQPPSETELKQLGPPVEQLQNAAVQDVNNLPLSQKPSQDECLQGQTGQVSHQNSQTSIIQNTEKVPNPIFNQEEVKTQNPSSDSQYAKLQQMSNQQATVNDQTSNQINRSRQVPFGMLLPILIPQLPKDRAMQLQTLFNKLKVGFSNQFRSPLIDICGDWFCHITIFCSDNFVVICSRKTKYRKIILCGL